eukprot:g7419.t1
MDDDDGAVAEEDEEHEQFEEGDKAATGEAPEVTEEVKTLWTLEQVKDAFRACDLTLVALSDLRKKVPVHLALPLLSDSEFGEKVACYLVYRLGGHRGRKDIKNGHKEVEPVDVSGARLNLPQWTSKEKGKKKATKTKRGRLRLPGGEAIVLAVKANHVPLNESFNAYVEMKETKKRFVRKIKKADFVDGEWHKLQLGFLMKETKRNWSSILGDRLAPVLSLLQSEIESVALLEHLDAKPTTESKKTPPVESGIEVALRCVAGHANWVTFAAAALNWIRGKETRDTAGHDKEKATHDPPNASAGQDCPAEKLEASASSSSSAGSTMTPDPAEESSAADEPLEEGAGSCSSPAETDSLPGVAALRAWLRRVLSVEQVGETRIWDSTSEDTDPEPPAATDGNFFGSFPVEQLRPLLQERELRDALSQKLVRSLNTSSLDALLQNLMKIDDIGLWCEVVEPQFDDLYDAMLEDGSSNQDYGKNRHRKHHELYRAYRLLPKFVTACRKCRMTDAFRKKFFAEDALGGRYVGEAFSGLKSMVAQQRPSSELVSVFGKVYDALAGGGSVESNVEVPRLSDAPLVEPGEADAEVAACTADDVLHLPTFCGRFFQTCRESSGRVPDVIFAEVLPKLLEKAQVGVMISSASRPSAEDTKIVEDEAPLYFQRIADILAGWIFPSPRADEQNETRELGELMLQLKKFIDGIDRSAAGKDGDKKEKATKGEASTRVLKSRVLEQLRSQLVFTERFRKHLIAKPESVLAAVANASQQARRGTPTGGNLVFPTAIDAELGGFIGAVLEDVFAEFSADKKKVEAADAEAGRGYVSAKKAFCRSYVDVVCSKRMPDANVAQGCFSRWTRCVDESEVTALVDDGMTRLMLGEGSSFSSYGSEARQDANFLRAYSNYYLECLLRAKQFRADVRAATDGPEKAPAASPSLVRSPLLKVFRAQELTSVLVCRLDEFFTRESSGGVGSEIVTRRVRELLSQSDVLRRAAQLLDFHHSYRPATSSELGLLTNAKQSATDNPRNDHDDIYFAFEETSAARKGVNEKLDGFRAGLAELDAYVSEAEAFGRVMERVGVSKLGRDDNPPSAWVASLREELESAPLGGGDRLKFGQKYKYSQLQHSQFFIDLAESEVARCKDVGGLDAGFQRCAEKHVSTWRHTLQAIGALEFPDLGAAASMDPNRVSFSEVLNLVPPSRRCSSATEEEQSAAVTTSARRTTLRSSNRSHSQPSPELSDEEEEHTATNSPSDEEDETPELVPQRQEKRRATMLDVEEEICALEKVMGQKVKRQKAFLACFCIEDVERKTTAAGEMLKTLYESFSYGAPSVRELSLNASRQSQDTRAEHFQVSAFKTRSAFLSGLLTDLRQKQIKDAPGASYAAVGEEVMTISQRLGPSSVGDQHFPMFEFSPLARQYDSLETAFPQTLRDEVRKTDTALEVLKTLSNNQRLLQFLGCNLKRDLEGELNEVVDDLHSEGRLDLEAVRKLSMVQAVLREVRNVDHQTKKAFAFPQAVLTRLFQKIGGNERHFIRAVDLCGSLVVAFKEKLESSGADRDDASKIKIQRLVQNGSFRVRVGSSPTCGRVSSDNGAESENALEKKIDTDRVTITASYRYSDTERKGAAGSAAERIFSEDDLRELKQQARMLESRRPAAGKTSKTDDATANFLQIFVNTFDSVVELQARLEEVRRSGHFGYRDYSATFAAQDLQGGCRLENACEEIKRDQKTWEEGLARAREKYPIMSKLVGSQMWDLLDFFRSAPAVAATADMQRVSTLLRWVFAQTEPMTESLLQKVRRRADVCTNADADTNMKLKIVSVADRLEAFGFQLDLLQNGTLRPTSVSTTLHLPEQLATEDLVDATCFKVWQGFVESHNRSCTQEPLVGAPSLFSSSSMVVTTAGQTSQAGAAGSCTSSVFMCCAKSARDTLPAVLWSYASLRLRPKADMMLFCVPTTGWDQVEAFLARWRQAAQGCLYALVNGELLEYDIQIRLVAEVRAEATANRAAAYLLLVVLEQGEVRRHGVNMGVDDRLPSALNAAPPRAATRGRGAGVFGKRKKQATNSTCYLLNEFRPHLVLDVWARNLRTAAQRTAQATSAAFSGGQLMTPRNASGNAATTEAEQLPKLARGIAACCDGGTSVRVVTSAYPGCGKSDYIRSLARKEGLWPIDLRLSGPMSLERATAELIAAFREQQEAVPGVSAGDHNKVKFCLHLHVNDVFFDAEPGESATPGLTAAGNQHTAIDANARTLSDLLFQLVFLKTLQSPCGALFHVPEIKRFFVEIANLSRIADKERPVNLGRSIPFFALFPVDDHLVFSFDRFCPSADSDSPDRIVARTLALLDSPCDDPADGRSRIDTVDLALDKVLGTSERLSADRVRALLRKYLDGGKICSFAQLNSAVEVLATQLVALHSSVFFSVENVDAQMQSVDVAARRLRSEVVKGLLRFVVDFCSPSVDVDSLRQQMQSLSFAEPSPTSGRAYGLDLIPWSQLKPMLVFHRNGRQTVSPLAKGSASSTLACFENVTRLLRAQGKNLPCYDSMTTQELIREAVKVVGFAGTATALSDASIDAIAQNYVVTPDNFLKMVRVALRAEARMPVILMGETGCGKTSLLQTLAKILGVTFFDMPIHAGVAAGDIVAFVKKCEEEAKRKATTSSREVWVFLDEINTCEYQGVISDLVVDRRMNGRRLSDNLVFLGAANPYRRRLIPEKESNLGGPAPATASAADVERRAAGSTHNKKRKYADLVYSVHPVPEKLLQFVYDFGKLGPCEEEQYVAIMCRGLARRLAGLGLLRFWYREDSSRPDNHYYRQRPVLGHQGNPGAPRVTYREDFKPLFPDRSGSTAEQEEFAGVASKLIWVSQKFITDRFPNYLVSLRDIKRCVELIFFLVGFYKERENIMVSVNQEFWSGPEAKSSQREPLPLRYMCRADKLLSDAMLFALMMCYHSRIPDREQRKEYRTLLEESMGGMRGQYPQHSQSFRSNPRVVHAYQETQAKYEDNFRTWERRDRNSEYEDFLLSYWHKEQHEKMVGLMKLPRDYVVTNTLAENIYVSVIGLLSRDPVIDVGKPGMSKSSALIIIDSNLKGAESEMPFWQRMPKLYVISYQGSDVSNSAGIERRFQKAEKMQQSYDKKFREAEANSNASDQTLLLTTSSSSSSCAFSPKRTVVLFLFDEIGLAEQSPNNPLKVLHAWLEPAQSKSRKPEFAFIALSNDQLDAAKMSRGLTINLPMPEPADLQNIASETMKSILGSEMQQWSGSVKNVIDALVRSYRKYYVSQPIADFHGLRDFYFLVRTFCRDVKRRLSTSSGGGAAGQQSQTADVEAVLLRALLEAGQRNFGGVPLSRSEPTTEGASSTTNPRSPQTHVDNGFLRALKADSTFEKLWTPKNRSQQLSLPEMLSRNLAAQQQGRHLLLVCKTAAHYEVALDLVRMAARKHSNTSDDHTPVESFVGSVYPRDVVSSRTQSSSSSIHRGSHVASQTVDSGSTYATDVLNRFMHNMEVGGVVVLRKLELIYGSLFHVLNMNYEEHENGEYRCRVALADIHKKVAVHPNFRCVILMEEADLPSVDVAFLNRAEKHFVGRVEDLFVDEARLGGVGETVAKLRNQLAKSSSSWTPKGNCHPVSFSHLESCRACGVPAGPARNLTAIRKKRLHLAAPRARVSPILPRRCRSVCAQTLWPRQVDQLARISARS